MMIMTRKRLNEEIAKVLEMEQTKQHIYNRIDYTNERIGTLEREVNTLRAMLRELGKTEIPSEYPCATTEVCKR